MPPLKSSRPSPRAVALANQARAVVPPQPSSPPTLATLLKAERPVTRRQHRLVDEVITRGATIDATQALSAYANRAIVQMHQDAQLTYYAIVRQLNHVKHSAASQDEETAQDMAEWTKAHKLLAARHVAGGLDGSVTRMLELTTKSLYEEEQEKPHGFLARLLGG